MSHAATDTAPRAAFHLMSVPPGRASIEALSLSRREPGPRTMPDGARQPRSSVSHLGLDGPAELAARLFELGHDGEVVDAGHVHDPARDAAGPPRGSEVAGLAVVLGPLL